MHLTGDQMRQLQEALESAFPDYSDLERLATYGLDLNLEEIAASRKLSTAVFDLLKSIKAGNRLEKLIKEALKENPGNNKLRAFAGQFPELARHLSAHPDTAPAPAYDLLRASSFDMNQQMETCLASLLGKQGLVGLAVPCDDDTFLDYFCDRLKDELGAGNVQKRTRLSLRPEFLSVEEAVTEIKLYRNRLRFSDVLCPVLVQAYDPALNNDIVSRFWKGARDAYAGDFPHRLIVPIVAASRTRFPRGLVRVEAPRFTSVHVHQWVTRIVQGKGWPPDMIATWKDCMVAECGSKEPLITRRVYQHLTDVLSHLPEATSLDSFRQTLEERRRDYAAS